MSELIFIQYWGCVCSMWAKTLSMCKLNRCTCVCKGGRGLLAGIRIPLSSLEEPSCCHGYLLVAVGGGGWDPIYSYWVKQLWMCRPRMLSAQLIYRPYRKSRCAILRFSLCPQRVTVTDRGEKVQPPSTFFREKSHLKSCLIITHTINSHTESHICQRVSQLI